MLIGQDAKIQIKATIRLKFDDGSYKEQIIQPGTMLEVTYVKNKSKLIKRGLVTAIGVVKVPMKEPVPNVINSLWPDIVPDGRVRCALEEEYSSLNYFNKKDDMPLKSSVILKIDMDFSKDCMSDIESIMSYNILDFELLQPETKSGLLDLYNQAKTILDEEEQLIEDGEPRYTEDSIGHLKYISSITKRSMLDDPNSPDEDIDCMTKLMQNALESLELIILEEEGDNNGEQDRPGTDNTDSESGNGIEEESSTEPSSDQNNGADQGGEDGENETPSGNENEEPQQGGEEGVNVDDSNNNDNTGSSEGDNTTTSGDDSDTTTSPEGDSATTGDQTGQTQEGVDDNGESGQQEGDTTDPTGEDTESDESQSVPEGNGEGNDTGGEDPDTNNASPTESEPQSSGDEGDGQNDGNEPDTSGDTSQLGGDPDGGSNEG